nr:hypothetical protein [Tanacetum cinerariifolium]
MSSASSAVTYTSVYTDSEPDDADDEDEDEEDGEEEEEHLAPADSAVVIPADELVSPPEGTEPVIPPPSTDTATTGTRITIRLQAAISFPPEAEVERLLAMPTPSPSSLTSLTLYKGTDDVLETEMPPRKRLCLSTLGSSDTWMDPAETVLEITPMTVREDIRTCISQQVDVDSQRVNLLIEDMIAYQETIQIVEDEAYAARVAWDHLIGLSQAVYYELQTHQEQVYAHEFQLQTHQTQLQLQSTLIQTQHQLHKTLFQMQQTEIAELRETDRRRQAQMAETLRVMGDMRREMGDIQIMALMTRQGPSTFPNNANPKNMTSESVQAMIDQALLQNSTNRDGSYRTEGVVGLTRWIKKMESVFQISDCAVDNQFVADETEKIDKYVSELPDNIYGSVKASKPKTLDETI